MPNYLDDQEYANRVNARSINHNLSGYMTNPISEDPGMLEWAGNAAEYVFSKFPTTWLQRSGLALSTHDFQSQGLIDTLDEAWDVSKKVTVDSIKQSFGDARVNYEKAFVEKFMPNLTSEHSTAAELAVGILTDPAILAGGAGLIGKGGKTLLKSAAAEGLKASYRGATDGIYSKALSKIYRTEVLSADDMMQSSKLAKLADRGDPDAARGLIDIVDKPEYKNGFDLLEQTEVAEEVAKYKATIGSPDQKLIKDFDLVTDEHIDTIMYGLDDSSLGRISQINFTKASALDVFNAIGKRVDSNMSRFMSRIGSGKASQKMVDAVFEARLSDILRKDVSHLTTADKIKLDQGIATVSNYVEVLAKRAMKNPDAVYDQAVQEGVSLLSHMDDVARAMVEGAGDDALKLLAKEKSGAAALDSLLMDNIAAFKRGDSNALKRLNSEMVSQLDSPHKMMRFIQSIKGAAGRMSGTMDTAYRFFIHSVLSGPQTHVVNMTSNTAYMMMQPVTHFLSSIPKLAYAPKEFLSTIDEARQMVVGAVESFGDAMRISTQFNKVKSGRMALKHNYDARLFRGHEAQEMLSKVDNFGYGFDGRAADAVDHLTTWKPGDWLMREDFFFKAMNYQMSARVQASKRARQLIKDGVENDLKTAFVKALDDPTESAIAQGIDFAAVNTFQKQLGETGGAMRLALQGPGLRWFFPFFRTQVNLIKIGAEHSPIGFYKALRDGLRGNRTAAELALTRASMGTGLALYVVNNVDTESITGTWEKGSAYDDLARSTGAPEYSVKIGDKWYDYSKIEPLRYILGLAATYKQALDNLDLSLEENLNTLNTLGSLIVEPFAKVSLDQRFLVTLSSVISSLQDLRKGNIAGFADKNSKRIVSGFVPNVLAQFNRYNIDPAFREADDFITRSISKIPSLSKTLPPHRNLFGDPVVSPSGIGPDMLSPIAVHKRKYNAVSNEIRRVQLNLERPRYEVQGQRLTEVEYSRLNEIAGKGSTRHGLPPIEDTLKSVIATDEYKRYSDEDKQTILKYYITKQRKYARQILLSETPDLMRRVQQREDILRSLSNSNVR